MITFDQNGPQNQYQDLDTQDGFCASCQEVEEYWRN